MARVRFIAFDVASLEEQAEALRACGHDVTAGGINRYGIRVLGRQPPEVFVLDANSEVDQMRRVVTALRRSRRLRHVPTICIGASGEQRARLSLAHPGVTFTTWPGIDAAIEHATRHAPG